MDYTQSHSFVTHTGTGQRMHKEQQAVPTAWSEKDANSIIWSLMEVLKAGGLAGAQFDPNLPSTYNLLLRAIRNINQAASSDLPGRVGIFLQPTPPTGWMRMNGTLLSRVLFPELWAHVQVVGAVSEADWAAGRQGWFSSGDGSTTFRIPLVGAEFIRALDDGRGVDIARLIGSTQAGDNAPHGHATVETPHGHATSETPHAHTGSSAPAGEHNHSGAKIPPRITDVDSTGSTASMFSTDSESTLPTEPAHTHVVTVNAASTGITVQAATTGITIASQGTEARPRNIAWPFYLKY